MSAEIIKELTTNADTRDVISEQVLSWVKRTEVQHSRADS